MTYLDYVIEANIFPNRADLLALINQAETIETQREDARHRIRHLKARMAAND